jgi:hypothetical protein
MSLTRNEELLVERLKTLVADPWIVEAATVTEVDEEKLTCTVELLFDETEIPNVRLKAAVDLVTDGMVQIPVVDSTVLVAMINNDIENRCIVAFSQVEKVLFFNGENGGLVNWPDAKEQLDKVKQLLTLFMNIVTGPPINEPGSGSPSAFQAALNGALNGKPLPSFEDLEDEKVKH